MVGNGFTTTANVPLFTQPLLSDTCILNTALTVWVTCDGGKVIGTVVVVYDSGKDCTVYVENVGGVTLITKLLVKQIGGAVAVKLGKGFTVTVAVLLFTQPLASVADTE